MKYSKRYIQLFFILVGLGVFLPAVLVIVVDPYHIYHKGLLEKNWFSKNERYQSAGLINSYFDDRYDSIIIGSSLSENFDTKKVASILGWQKTLRLTLNASTSYMPQEHIKVLKKALSTHHVQHVLWEIHPQYIWVQDDRVDEVSEGFPGYLYNTDFLDDYKYVFNDDVVRLSLRYLSGGLNSSCDSNCQYQWNLEWLNDFETLNAWMLPHQRNPKNNGFVRYGNSASLQKYKEKVFDNQNKIKLETIKKISESYRAKFITSTMAEVIKQNPETQFVIYTPPIPSFYYAAKHNKAIGNYLGFIRQMLTVFYKQENVKVYGFNNLFDITNNVAFYKDEHHYHSDVNHYILRRIANHQDLLSISSFEAYAEKFVVNLKTLQVIGHEKVQL